MSTIDKWNRADKGKGATDALVVIQIKAPNGAKVEIAASGRSHDVAAAIQEAYESARDEVIKQAERL